MVVIQYATQSEKATIQLGDVWRVHPSDELIIRLQQLAGDNDAITIKYR